MNLPPHLSNLYDHVSMHIQETSDIFVLESAKMSVSVYRQNLATDMTGLFTDMADLSADKAY